jgi:hypothetical protein
MSILCPRCEGKGVVPNLADCGLTTIRCTWYDELWEDRRITIPEKLDMEDIPDKPTEDEFVHLLMEHMSKPLNAIKRSERGGAHGEDKIS